MEYPGGIIGIRSTGRVSPFRPLEGEALYGAHDGDDCGDITRALRAIGRPALVQVSLPGREIGSYCSPGERVMRVFLGRRGINTGHEVSFAGVIRGARIPPERVLRVIDREEPDFEALTAALAGVGIAD